MGSGWRSRRTLTKPPLTWPEVCDAASVVIERGPSERKEVACHGLTMRVRHADAFSRGHVRLSWQGIAPTFGRLADGV